MAQYWKGTRCYTADPEFIVGIATNDVSIHNWLPKRATQKGTIKIAATEGNHQ